jgi:hypothetical protein
VTGLGDEAYFDLANDQLGVKEGDSTLLLTYLTLAAVSDDKIRARLGALARAARQGNPKGNSTSSARTGVPHRWRTRWGQSLQAAAQR